MLKIIDVVMSEIEEMSTLRLSRNLESYFECWDAEDASFTRGALLRMDASKR